MLYAILGVSAYIANDHEQACAQLSVAFQLGSKRLLLNDGSKRAQLLCYLFAHSNLWCNRVSDAAKFLSHQFMHDLSLATSSSELWQLLSSACRLPVHSQFCKVIAIYVAPRGVSAFPDEELTHFVQKMLRDIYTRASAGET